MTESDLRCFTPIISHLSDVCALPNFEPAEDFFHILSEYMIYKDESANAQISVSRLILLIDFNNHFAVARNSGPRVSALGRAFAECVEYVSNKSDASNKDGNGDKSFHELKLNNAMLNKTQRPDNCRDVDIVSAQLTVCFTLQVRFLR